MDAELLWEQNVEEINKTANSIAGKYRNLISDVASMAKGTFYNVFEKYYAKGKVDDKKCIHLFAVCFKHTVISAVRVELKWREKYAQGTNEISNALSNSAKCRTLVSNGNYLRTLDEMSDSTLPNQESEQYVRDINEYVKKRLSEYDYFVYEQLIEGWEEFEIAEILCDSPRTVARSCRLIRETIDTLIKEEMK